MYIRSGCWKMNKWVRIIVLECNAGEKFFTVVNDERILFVPRKGFREAVRYQLIENKLASSL